MAKTYGDNLTNQEMLKILSGDVQKGDMVGGSKIENIQITPEGLKHIQFEGIGGSSAIYNGKFVSRGAYLDHPATVSFEEAQQFLKHNEPSYTGYITPPEGRPVLTPQPGELTKNGQPFMPGQPATTAPGAVDNTPVIDPRFGTEPIPGAEYAQKYAELNKPPVVAEKPNTQVLGAAAGTNISADGVDRAATPYGVSGYAGFSIVDYLKSVNQPNDYASRAKLAEQFGIQGYAGTADQNTKLLQTLRSQQGKSLEQIQAELKTITEKTQAIGGAMPSIPGGGGAVGGGTPAGTAPGGTTPAPETAPGGAGGAPGGGTATGGTSTPTPGTGTPSPDQIAIDKAARDKAAADAQAEADKIFASIKDTTVDTRDSAKILADIKTDIEAPPAEPKSLVETFNAKKAALGIEPLETQLSTIDSNIEAIQTTLQVEAQKAGQQLVSMREINRTKGTLQMEAEQRIALLNVEKSAVSRQLTNKYNTLETIMSLTQNDFTNASNYYTQNLARTTALYNLVNQKEQQTLTAQDRAKDDARANLTVIQNLLKDSSVDYSSFTADQKLKMQQLEVQAGYPAGFLEKIDTQFSDKKIQSTTSFTGTDGKQYFNVLMVDGNNKLSVETIADDGTVQKADTTKTTEEQLATARGAMGKYLSSKSGPDNHVAEKDYLEQKKIWVNSGIPGATSESFDEAFAGVYVNPEYPKSYGLPRDYFLTK